jgi:hypothetical protein
VCRGRQIEGRRCSWVKLKEASAFAVWKRSAVAHHQTVVGLELEHK